MHQGARLLVYEEGVGALPFAEKRDFTKKIAHRNVRTRYPSQAIAVVDRQTGGHDDTWRENDETC